MLLALDAISWFFALIIVPILVILRIVIVLGFTRYKYVNVKTLDSNTFDLVMVLIFEIFSLYRYFPIPPQPDISTLEQKKTVGGSKPTNPGNIMTSMNQSFNRFRFIPMPGEYDYMFEQSRAAGYRKLAFVRIIALEDHDEIVIHAPWGIQRDLWEALKPYFFTGVNKRHYQKTWK